MAKRPALVPPLKFGIVEPELYRSAPLQPINFPFVAEYVGRYDCFDWNCRCVFSL